MRLKISSIIIILLLLFITGCQSLKIDNWSKLTQYLNDNGEIIYNGTDNVSNYVANYTVKMKYKDDNTILVTYIFENNELQNYSIPVYNKVTLTSEIIKNEETSLLKGEANTILSSARMTEKASTEWNIGTYKIGNEVIWDDYDKNGNKVNGSQIINQPGGGFITDPTIHVRRLVIGIVNILSDTKLEISMSDIGFSDYERKE